MSAVSDFLTEPTFWWGGLAGSALTAVVAPIITARSVRASDKRKAAHETAMQDRKDEREDKLRRERDVYEAATEFAAVCSDILTNSVDLKGAFNAIRDAFYNRLGAPDPAAEDKMSEGLRLAEQTKRFTTPFNKLKMVASGELLSSATRLNVAILAVLRTTTEPFAKPVALKTAGDELDTFINAFREECGRERYESNDAMRDAESFMATLKQQVDAYMEEAKAEMKAAGFKTTPWDNM